MFRIYFIRKLSDKLTNNFVPFRTDFNEVRSVEYFSLYKCFQRRFSTCVTDKSVKYKRNSLVFSREDQVKILQVLNSHPEDSFKRLNIPSMQIDKLKVWKSKKGLFNSINDVLDIEGIDVKTVVKICQSIILDKPFPTNRKTNVLKSRHFVSPTLSNDVIEKFTSSVGIHFGPAGISWAHISGPVRKLNYWGSKNFSDLPMKITSWENFELAMEVLNEIPTADVYVFETPGFGVQPQSQLGAVASYTQRIEFISMLLALLNTSKKHNKRINNEKKLVGNVVYYLKAKLSARLFKTWVGNESVSTITSVEQIFNNDEDHLPCSPIEIDQTMMNIFERQSSCNKEILGQSLLLAIAFLDLCVYKNPVSFKALGLPNRNN